jgi:predicted permease
MTTSDIKYAFRLLSKSPWFTVLTVLVLAGGLAISIYTFAFLSTIIYRDLPLPDGDSIVRINPGQSGFEVLAPPLDPYELAQIRTEVSGLSEIGAYRTSQALLGDEDSSRSAITTETEWNIFEFARTPPLMGRGFVRGDNLDGAEPVAVIGYHIWQSHFSGDPDVVGEVVMINGERTRIVGVMPERFAFPLTTEVWLPLSTRDLDPPGYLATTIQAYERLRPGVSARAAETELTELLQRVQRQRPNANEHDLGVAVVTSFQEAQWGTLGPRVFGVLNALALAILLLACVNVGNLLLARTNERIREISVRVALGAPRFRLIVQMMLENVIVCVMGGLLALFLAVRALKATTGFFTAMTERLGASQPFWWTWGLDSSIAAAAVLFLLLTILLVSVLPVYSVSSVSPSSLLRDGTHGARGRSSGRISRALVTMEVALISIAMLVGSAVAVIAYRAVNFDWGMDTADLFMMEVELPAETYDTGEKQLSFYQSYLAELRDNGRIEAATIMRELGETRFGVAGAEYFSEEDYPRAMLVTLSETSSPIGPTLLEGRRFDSRDSATGLRTVIVSKSLAETHWPRESALGKRIDVFAPNGTREERIVVGVMSDVRYNPVSTSERSRAAFYVPVTQLILPVTRFVIKYRGTDEQARAAMYGALRNLDASLPASRVMRYDTALQELTLFASTMTNLFIGCGVFAILLAMTGIYGLTSNTVVRRTHEIGLRRALGASNGNIIALFLAQGSGQLVVGVLVSALVSSGILYAISQFAPIGASLLTFICTAVLLVVSGLVLISVYVSVRRAVRREPSVALRYG